MSKNWQITKPVELSAPLCLTFELYSMSEVLRTGVLFKKGSGTGPFGRKNWKPRYFVLTPARLQYFTFEDGELKGELSLQGCDEGVLEVMPADSMKTGSSASTIWRVAINAPERRLLVAASTEMEMNDWVDKLVMAFRMNSGQPSSYRSSMPAPSSTYGTMPGTNMKYSNPKVRDFQNFSVPRRTNQRHSTGAADMRPTFQEQEFLLAQLESMETHQSEEKRRVEVEQEQEAQLRRQDILDAEMRDDLVLEQQREQEEAALAAADALQRLEEQQKQEQLKLQKENERQQVIELQRVRRLEEVARLQHEKEQEKIQSRQLADEVLQKATLKNQQGEDVLERQRREKREQHARQRAQHEKALQLQKEQEDLVFRMSQQLQTDLSEENTEQFLPEPQASTLRSSVIGNVKRELIQKQKQEHQRRREAALQQKQRNQEVKPRRHQVEGAKVEMTPFEMEVAPREIEVVRRAPIKKPVSPTAVPMGSVEF